MARSVPSRPDPARPDPNSDLATEVADLLHHVNHAIRRTAAAGAEPHAATGAQMRAMRTLTRRGAPMRMSELADALGIVRRSATSVVDELEQLGLVERVDDPTDGRAVGVRLTSSGLKVMAEARRRRRTAAGRVLAPLSEAEMITLRSLLQRLGGAPT